VPLGSPAKRPVRAWGIGAAVALVGLGGWYALGPTAAADLAIDIFVPGDTQAEKLVLTSHSVASSATLTACAHTSVPCYGRDAMVVHQLLPNYRPGDAMGAAAVAFRRVLRRLGFWGELYAGEVDPGSRSWVRRMTRSSVSRARSSTTSS